ncbi:hypothetical protein ACH5RR_019893 [Cinchona calisaya]|uniref:Late embryogenesis abundant protein n=1 Tax=Cinchona calisaya TaxID=153742 RepID=A0ABD2ZQP5_9GENT
MAAYKLQSTGLAGLGKRFLRQINSDSFFSPASSSFLLRRTVHVSVYDKNPEEHVRPTVVPDYVIQSGSEEYWAPHPQTGVFGPSTEQQNPLASVVNVPEGSVLEQKAFFRPLEDLEKPPPQP